MPLLHFIHSIHCAGQPLFQFISRNKPQLRRGHRRRHCHAYICGRRIYCGAFFRLLLKVIRRYISPALSGKCLKNAQVLSAISSSSSLSSGLGFSLGSLLSSAHIAAGIANHSAAKRAAMAGVLPSIAPGGHDYAHDRAYVQRAIIAVYSLWP